MVTFSYLLDPENWGGATLMAAQAALKAGVGLLTVGIPESLHPSFVARRPGNVGPSS